MKLEHRNEIAGIVILGISLIVLASLVSYTPYDLPWFVSRQNLHPANWIGIAGSYMAGILFFLAGFSAYFFVVMGLFLSWNKFTSRELPFNFFKFLSALILLVVLASLFSFFAPGNGCGHFNAGGIAGFVFCNFLIHYFQPLGTLIILLMLGGLSLIITGEFLVSPFFVWAGLGILRSFQKVFRGEIIPKIPGPRALPQTQTRPLKSARPKLDQETVMKGSPVTQPEASKTSAGPQAVVSAQGALTKPNIHIIAGPKMEAAAPGARVVKNVGEYHLPGIDLLKSPPPPSDDKVQQDLESGAKILEETLADFGVNVKVADIERGPVITRYELQPAPGVKVGSIASLSNDLAMALSASAVRILAPIPGKNRVGIEVPNSSTATVFLKDVLSFTHARAEVSKLDLSIGKETSGKPLVVNLADMPHLLVAGTTGSGKTVCLNSIIMSILFSASPSDVKFIMIDPKMVEMIPYNDLPHLLAPVVTDARKATWALNFVVAEMEARYRLFNKEAVRNIKGYHDKGFAMPYIVVVVDELADLMQVSAKSVEGAITRLSQLARATGIHLILATQRPSVDVITGVIKANFSSRISFKVASKIDSRTVLDANGAETLLGKGDFLFMRTGDPKPIRGQCCYVSDEEINGVINFIKKQCQPEYNESVLKPQPTTDPRGLDEKDELYDEAVKVVVETNQASVTILQRRLRLGYSRAARLIDMMEQNGLVGPYAGSKARDILVDREKWLLDNGSGRTSNAVNGQQ